MEKQLEQKNQERNSTLEAGILSERDFLLRNDKKILLKSGAEKILRHEGYRVEFVILDKIINLEVISFLVECRVVDAEGKLICNSFGSCNSEEYKQRLGKNFNLFVLQNTIIKLATKRAMVACALFVGALSEKFTQDLEEEQIAEILLGDDGGEKKEEDKQERKEEKNELRKIECKVNYGEFEKQKFLKEKNFKFDGEKKVWVGEIAEKDIFDLVEKDIQFFVRS